jgi:hypothetical protein
VSIANIPVIYIPSEVLICDYPTGDAR